MSQTEAFKEHIIQGNTCKGAYITVGAAMLDGTTITGAHVNLPLKTLNRHGLIAGATGTGKTKTLQVLAVWGRFGQSQLELRSKPVMLPMTKAQMC